MTDIAGAMRSGNIESLSNHDSARLPGILLGSDAAKELGVTVGDTVSVLTGERFVLTPTGRVPRRGIDLRVTGTFNLGVYEIDSQTGFVSMDTAKRLFDKDSPDAIQLRLDDIYQAQKISDDIGHMLGADYVVQDWGDLNRSLFDALWLEKMAVSLTIWSHRDGRRVEHRRVVDSARDGEASRHRYFENHGRGARSIIDRVHDAGLDHRHHRHDDGRDHGICHG